MELKFLPNTAVAASIVSKDEIYTYAQLYDGRIVEIQGRLAGENDTYQPTGTQNAIDMTMSGRDFAAKRFTPLAAVYFESQRYVFYLDPGNRIRSVTSQDGTDWTDGTIYETGWVAAEYSSLTAIKLTNSGGYQFICLYYQDTTPTGNIILVNNSPDYGWQTGNPPLDDPPLYGTPLAVVPPQPGIEVVQTVDNKDPVVFFQYDNLMLGSSQDQGLSDYASYTVSNSFALSPRGAITALDDGNNFWCFYTTDKNEVYRLRVDENGAITQPQKVALDDALVPRSGLAGVIHRGPASTKIVLFYLLRHDHVNLFATTLTSTTNQAADDWNVSRSICLDPAPTYPIIGIPAGSIYPAIPIRYEADTWYPGQTEEHLIQNSLFLYALQSFQARDPTDKLSFFQIGGIHGMPYQPWDEDTSPVTPQEGYCTHDSILFPCWHRPYVLLFESAWTDAANSWRLPYWDWAQKKTRPGKSSPIYDVPLIAKEPRIGVYDLNDGVTVVYIDNPMYKFVMPGNKPMYEYGVTNVPDDPEDIPFERCVGTSRWAVYSPESSKSSEDWIDGVVDNSKVADAMDGHDWYNKPSGPENVPLREMVYRLYVRDYISTYTQFATTKFDTSKQYNPDAPSAFLNLEFVHNNIHNWTGGTDKYIGHMTEVPVAGFDPIFFFHHCNVDRLFALWQAVNEKRTDKNWFEDKDEQLTDDGNWYIGEGDTDTPSTYLAPFHSDKIGTYYTPDTVRDWAQFGYTYPELQPWLDKYLNGNGKFDEDKYIADVQSQIKNLYGSDTGSSSNQAVAGLGFEQWTKDIIVNITYDRFAFGGVPYTIYLFIGDPEHLNNNDGPLATHSQHVGFVYTFSNPVLPQQETGRGGCQACKRKRDEGSKSRGQVPITGALVARLQGGNGGESAQLPPGIPSLASLESETVDQYLEKNLHWRVRSHGGRDFPIPEDNPFIQVSVYHRNARFDDVTNPAQYQRLKKATGTKPGGYRPTLPLR